MQETGLSYTSVFRCLNTYLVFLLVENDPKLASLRFKDFCGQTFLQARFPPPRNVSPSLSLTVFVDPGCHELALSV